jgi:hypothetical protein
MASVQISPAICGLWEPQEEEEEVAFIDVPVADSDAAAAAASYVSQPAMHALTSAEDEKIRKYHEACESTACVLGLGLGLWSLKDDNLDLRKELVNPRVVDPLLLCHVRGRCACSPGY